VRKQNFVLIKSGIRKPDPIKKTQKTGLFNELLLEINAY
jgi:hypothetical protein